MALKKYFFMSTFPVYILVQLEVSVDVPNPVLERTNANITCVVKGGEIVKSFMWKKGNEVLSETSAKLAITNIPRNSTDTTYKCKATPFKGNVSDEATGVLYRPWCKNCYTHIIRVRNSKEKLL